MLVRANDIIHAYFRPQSPSLNRHKFIRNRRHSRRRAVSRACQIRVTLLCIETFSINCPFRKGCASICKSVDGRSSDCGSTRNHCHWTATVRNISVVSDVLSQPDPDIYCYQCVFSSNIILLHSYKLVFFFCLFRSFCAEVLGNAAVFLVEPGPDIGQWHGVLRGCRRQDGKLIINLNWNRFVVWSPLEFIEPFIAVEWYLVPSTLVDGGPCHGQGKYRDFSS